MSFFVLSIRFFTFRARVCVCVRYHDRYGREAHMRMTVINLINPIRINDENNNR